MLPPIPRGNPHTPRTLSKNVRIASALWGTSILLSRLVSMVREGAIGRILGASAASDVYNASFQLPDFLNYLLAAGALSIVFIPIFAGHLARGEERRGWEAFDVGPDFGEEDLGRRPSAVQRQ